MRIPFFKELESAQTILLAGAGGGYDIFTGLPLYLLLRSAGKTVHLANLSSGALGFCDAEKPIEGLWQITSKTAAPKYFPEMHLSGFLSDRFGETPIYSIAPEGARPVMAAYDWLARTLNPDTVILIDGGTDSLMRGDEAGLGTPEGDMVSLLAAHSLTTVTRKFLMCLGFGVDAHHGVCHAHFLENVSHLIADEGFLGTWSLVRDSEEFALYRDACEYVFARLPNQPSIVNTSIISAVNGEFGDRHSTERTEGSTLFINPLMAIFWAFRLEQVARHNLLFDCIKDTDTFAQVSMAIEKFRDSQTKTRVWKNIPV